MLAAVEAVLQQWPNGPRHAESLFRKAEAMEKISAGGGDARKAAPDVTPIYRRIWAEAPLQAWGDRAAERLDQIAAALPTAEAAIVRAHTAGEWVSRGMVLFDQNRNVESEAAFNSALTAPGLDADLECRARFHRAQSVWKQRQRPRAAPLFDEAEAACARAGEPRPPREGAVPGGALLRERGEPRRRDGALRAHRGGARRPQLRRRRAAAHRPSWRPTPATSPPPPSCCREIPTRYPKGDLLNEALWRLAFSSWRAGRDDDALHWLDENLRLVPHEDVWYAEGRVLYWKGRVFEKQGKTDDGARLVRARRARVPAVGLRAAVAEVECKALHPRRGEGADRGAAQGTARRPGLDVPGAAAVRRRRLPARRRAGAHGPGRRRAPRARASWACATSGREALDRRGPRRGRGSRLDHRDRCSIAAASGARRTRCRATRSRTTSSTTRRAIGEAKWKLAYPRAFPALVAKNAKANQLPEALQLAIMREESAFSPRIESFANAIGLTQMLVKTAKRFANGATVDARAAAGSGEEPRDRRRASSASSGSTSTARRRWRSPATTRARRAVDRWLGERGDLAIDEFIETIPYDETRNYTKRVLASYFTYSWLYGKQPVPTLPLGARGKAGEKKKSDGDGDSGKASHAGRTTGSRR